MMMMMRAIILMMKRKERVKKPRNIDKEEMSMMKMTMRAGKRKNIIGKERTITRTGNTGKRKIKQKKMCLLTG